VDGIVAEIADAGLETALAALAVQTRNLVLLMTLQHGEEATRRLLKARDQAVMVSRSGAEVFSPSPALATSVMRLRPVRGSPPPSQASAECW
jgi:hypothetical protein